MHVLRCMYDRFICMYLDVCMIDLYIPATMILYLEKNTNSVFRVIEEIKGCLVL